MRVMWLRRGVQLLSLLLFVLLLAQTTWPLRAWLSPQLFLRADPLSALAVALSPGRTWALLGFFWPALVVLAATALAGRFFCGWLCPLGTCVDAADTLLRAGRRSTRFHHPGLKTALLALVLIVAVFGTHLLYLDPIPLLTRVGATVVDPGARQMHNLAFAQAGSQLRDWGLRLRPVEERPFALSVLTGGLFLLILLGGLFGRRFWCRNLCPLGGLLGLVGSRGLWRRRVGTACNSCTACARSCKMSAIPAGAPDQTHQAECIQCYACVPGCRRQDTALVWGVVPVQTEVDADRRQFLTVAAAGLSYGALASLGVIPRFAGHRVLRPPGAVVRGPDGVLQRLMTEDEFRAKCLRCGQCMKACITGGLQPAVTECGVDGFYTPVLKPRAGWCEQNCQACGLVCPSGALVPFSVEEKRIIRIGRAQIDRERCLAWGRGDQYRECLVCNEHCSYEAVVLRDEDGGKRPYVSHRECVGCGQCEAVCPVKQEAAIIVYRARR